MGKKKSKKAEKEQPEFKSEEQQQDNTKQTSAGPVAEEEGKAGEITITNLNKN
jgi:hypothetical protein